MDNMLLIELTGEGEILTIKGAVEALTGRLPGVLSGQNWGDIFFPGEYTQQGQTWLNRLRLSDICDEVITVYDHKGVPIPLRFMTSRRFHPDGSLTIIGCASATQPAEGRLATATARIELITSTETVTPRHLAVTTKGDRYRTIFETPAVSIWEVDFSAVRAEIDRLRALGLTDFNHYLNRYPDRLRELIMQIRVVDVNETTMRMFGAQSKNELLGTLDRVFLPKSMHILQDCILAIAEGRAQFEGETVARTLFGKVLHVFLTLRIPTQIQKFGCILLAMMDITERKLVEESLQQRLNELEVLHDVAMITAEVTDLGLLLNNAVHLIGKALYPENLGVFLIDESAKVLRLYATYKGLDLQEDIAVLPIGVGITGQVAQDGLPRRVGDVAQHPGYVSSDPRILSELCVPLKIDDHVIGVLNAESREADAYSEVDEHLLVTIAGQLATAIHRAKLYGELQHRVEELHRHNQELARLAEASGALLFGAERDLRSVSHRVVETLTHEFGQSNCSLYLLNESGHLKLVEVAGIKAEAYHNGNLTQNDPGLMPKALRLRKIINVADVSQSPDTIGGWDEARSELVIPLAVRDRIIGVFDIQSDQVAAFTPQDEKLMVIFAEQAALALENARLFEEMERRLSEMEAVSRVSSAMRTAETLEEMLPILLDETLSILETNAGAILLYNPSRNMLESVASRGWFKLLGESIVRPGEGIAGHVFTVGDVYLSREFTRDGSVHTSSQERIESGWGGACLPIHTAQSVVGVMFVSVKLPRELGKQEVSLLKTLAEIAGNAVHRMRLYEQTSLRLQRLSALRSIDQAINASVDLRVTLNILLSQLMAQLRVDAAEIFLLRANIGALESVARRGFRFQDRFAPSLRLGEGVAGRAALDRRVIYVPSLAEINKDEPIARQSINEGFVSFYCSPLVAKGEVKGVLEVFFRSPSEHDPEWLEFFEALANQAALAIDNASLFDGLQRSNLELSLAYDATIEGWSKAMDLRDQVTEGHTQRVVDLTLRLARSLGFSENDEVHLRRGALLHDIGKMGIPDSILQKPGPLNRDERVVMDQHPIYAYNFLSSISFLKPALDIPYGHHEKWDGSGYPRGLKGEQIPLPARLFAVVDNWDALTSTRPYRQAWPEERVKAYLREKAGTHFDPHVVEAFLNIIG